jgi:hypothetical protein
LFAGRSRLKTDTSSLTPDVLAFAHPVAKTSMAGTGPAMTQTEPI